MPLGCYAVLAGVAYVGGAVVSWGQAAKGIEGKTYSELFPSPYTHAQYSQSVCFYKLFW